MILKSGNHEEKIPDCYFKIWSTQEFLEVISDNAMKINKIIDIASNAIKNELSEGCMFIIKLVESWKFSCQSSFLLQ